MDPEQVRRYPCLAELPKIMEVLGRFSISCLSGPIGSCFNIVIAPLLSRDAKVILVEPTEGQANWTAKHIRHIFSEIKLSLYPEKSPCDIYVVSLAHFYQETLKLMQGQSIEPLNLLNTNYLFIDQANLLLAEMDLINDIWKNSYISGQGSQLCKLVLITNSNEDLDNIIILKNISIPSGRLELPFTRNNSISYLDADTTSSMINTGILSSLNVMRSKGYKNKMDFNQATKYVIEFLDELYKRGVVGNVLILLPGKEEADMVSRSLINLPNGVTLVKAYSPDHEIDPLYTDKTKLIVATDLINVTSTLDRIALVVDLMRYYRRDKSNADSIEIEPSFINKAMAKTNTQLGIHCFQVITTSDYNGLHSNTKPELVYLPLYFYLLDLYQAGITPNIITRFIGSYHKILDESVKVLQDLGTIDNNQITERGRLARSFSLSLRNNLVLLNWIERGLPPYVIIVILCMIEGRPYWWYIHSKKDQNTWDIFRKYSDVETLTNLWLVAMDKVGGPTAPERHIWDWCKTNFINSKRFVETLNRIKLLVKEVERYMEIRSTAETTPIRISHFSLTNAMDELRQSIKAGYSDRIVTLLDPVSRTYVIAGKSNRYVLDTRAVSDMWRYPTRELIALEIYPIGRQGSNTFNLALSLNISEKPDQMVTSTTSIAPSEQEILALLGGSANLLTQGSFGVDLTGLTGTAAVPVITDANSFTPADEGEGREDYVNMF